MYIIADPDDTGMLLADIWSICDARKISGSMLDKICFEALGLEIDPAKMDAAQLRAVRDKIKGGA